MRSANISGNIVLEHSLGDGYSPSAFLLTGPGGHADVVRCMYHSSSDQALYTGSEDGVLAGWSLASLGHGESAGEGEGEAEGDQEGGMEVDGQEHEDEETRRRRERAERKSKKEKRREKRHAPY